MCNSYNELDLEYARRECERLDAEWAGVVGPSEPDKKESAHASPKA